MNQKWRRDYGSGKRKSEHCVFAGSLYYQRGVGGGEQGGGGSAGEAVRYGESGRSVRRADLGGSGKQYAEGGVYAGTWKGACESGESEVSVRRGSAQAGHRHLHGRGGAADPYVRAVRGMLHIRRGARAGCNEHSGGVRRVYACRDVQPLRERGEGVPFPSGLCQPETAVRPLDRDRKRRLSGRDEEEPCADHRRYGGKDRGLRTEGFAEYGGVHGAGSDGYDRSESA